MLRLLIIAVVSTMLLIPIAGFSSNIITNEPILIVVSVGLGYVVIPVILLRLWPKPKIKKGKEWKSIAEALEEGELLTIEHEVRDVAEIEEFEDEGLHFLLKIETGETLYLCGQYLYGIVERNEFPSCKVRLFTNKVTGQFYGIEPVGERITNWSRYTFTDESIKSEFAVADGELHLQSIAEIISELGCQFVGWVARPCMA